MYGPYINHGVGPEGVENPPTNTSMSKIFDTDVMINGKGFMQRSRTA